MQIKRFALIVLLILVLLPARSAFASRLSARISAVRPFNSLQAATPTSIPSTPGPTETAPSGPPLSLTLMLLFTCCAVGLVLGILGIGLLTGINNRKASEEDKKEK